MNVIDLQQEHTDHQGEGVDQEHKQDKERIEAVNAMNVIGNNNLHQQEYTDHQVEGVDQEAEPERYSTSTKNEKKRKTQRSRNDCDWSAQKEEEREPICSLIP